MQAYETSRHNKYRYFPCGRKKKKKAVSKDLGKNLARVKARLLWALCNRGGKGEEKSSFLIFSKSEITSTSLDSVNSFGRPMVLGGPASFFPLPT